MHDDEESVMRMHSYDRVKARVTICYRDYRSNDRCTKYRDAIILLLLAAMRYFRFGIRITRVTKQSIHNYGNDRTDTTGNICAFFIGLR